MGEKASGALPELLRALEVKDENLGVKIAVVKAIRSIDRKLFEGIADWRSFLAHQQSAGEVPYLHSLYPVAIRKGKGAYGYALEGQVACETDSEKGQEVTEARLAERRGLEFSLYAYSVYSYLPEMICVFEVFHARRFCGCSDCGLHPASRYCEF